MTLHEAIVKVLNQIGQPARASHIADLLNQQNLYQRNDREPIPPNQISARIRNYSNLFYKDGPNIGLIQWKTMPNKFKKTEGETAMQQPDPPSETLLTKEWDVRRISGLKAASFKLIGRLGFILKQGLPMEQALNQCGIYAISIPSRY